MLVHYHWSQYEDVIACQNVREQAVNGALTRIGGDDDNNENMSQLMPPQSHVKCHGNTGTGRDFVIISMRNITRNLSNSNKDDQALGPTGCSSSLINGTTNNIFFIINVGKEFKKVTRDWNQNKVTIV